MLSLNTVPELLSQLGVCLLHAEAASQQHCGLIVAGLIPRDVNTVILKSVQHCGCILYLVMLGANPEGIFVLLGLSFIVLNI